MNRLTVAENQQCLEYTNYYPLEFSRALLKMDIAASISMWPVENFCFLTNKNDFPFPFRLVHEDMTQAYIVSAPVQSEAVFINFAAIHWRGSFHLKCPNDTLPKHCVVFSIKHQLPFNVALISERIVIC